MRGLKRKDSSTFVAATNVARSTRAWIETTTSNQTKCGTFVARSTRAWIETETAITRSLARGTSHALRVRGLKQVVPKALAKPVERRTLYACVD